MASRIKFIYKGKAYTLEYSRNTVKQMEAQGFQIDEIWSKPLTSVLTLFSGAFLMHHPNVFRNKALCEEIYRSLPGRDKLLETLVQLYQEPVLSLLDEPEENEGNTSWEVE